MFANFGPVIIGCTVVVGAVILYERRKSERRSKQDQENFWSREYQSNNVRRKDISFLNYLSVPIDSLPMEETGDEEIAEYQNTVRALSGRRILNLTGISNTELKETYGVANLALLSEYDENYTTLVNTLARWGARLFALNRNADAVTVLEYGVSIGTDVSRNYYLLADEYRKQNKPEEIDRLTEAVGQINSVMKPAIQKKLQEIRGYLA